MREGFKKIKCPRCRGFGLYTWAGYRNRCELCDGLGEIRIRLLIKSKEPEGYDVCRPIGRVVSVMEDTVDVRISVPEDVTPGMTEEEKAADKRSAVEQKIDWLWGVYKRTFPVVWMINGSEVYAGDTPEEKDDIPLPVIRLQGQGQRWNGLVMDIALVHGSLCDVFMYAITSRETIYSYRKEAIEFRARIAELEKEVGRLTTQLHDCVPRGEFA